MRDSRAAEWRRKCLDGTITLDDYREAIAALREDRQKAHVVKKIKRQKSTENLLKELVDKGNEESENE